MSCIETFDLSFPSTDPLCARVRACMHACVCTYVLFLIDFVFHRTLLPTRSPPPPPLWLPPIFRPALTPTPKQTRQFVVQARVVDTISHFSFYPRFVWRVRYGGTNIKAGDDAGS